MLLLCDARCLLTLRVALNAILFVFVPCPISVMCCRDCQQLTEEGLVSLSGSRFAALFHALVTGLGSLLPRALCFRFAERASQRHLVAGLATEH